MKNSKQVTIVVAYNMCPKLASFLEMNLLIYFDLSELLFCYYFLNFGLSPSSTFL
jgi:hypothetical protein